jgi:hypothetical protein
MYCSTKNIIIQDMGVQKALTDVANIGKDIATGILWGVT